MTFEEWHKKEGISQEHIEFARTVWNAAIQSARDLVAERHDEMEPWLCA